MMIMKTVYRVERTGTTAEMLRRLITDVYVVH